MGAAICFCFGTAILEFTYIFGDCGERIVDASMCERDVQTYFFSVQHFGTIG